MGDFLIYGFLIFLLGAVLVSAMQSLKQVSKESKDAGGEGGWKILVFLALVGLLIWMLVGVFGEAANAAK